MNRRSVVTAAALILVPVMVGLLVFQLRAPGRGDGVYVEVEARGIASVHELVAVSDAAALPEYALAVPAGVPLGFFIVGDRGRTARLSLHVTNSADPLFQVEALPLTAAVRVIDERTIQLTSDALRAAWQPGAAAFDYYQRMVNETLASRSTLSVMAVLEVSGGSGGRAESYGVVLGPRVLAPLPRVSAR